MKWLVLNDWGFYFSLPFSLFLSFFPKQKRAWDRWCLISPGPELGDQPGWSPGWWASPCPGAESRALNHHGAQEPPVREPCEGIGGPYFSLLGKAPAYCPAVTGVVLVLYVVGFCFCFCFFSWGARITSPSPLRVKTKGKNSWEIKEVEERCFWFSVPTWFPSLPPEVCAQRAGLGEASWPSAPSCSPLAIGFSRSNWAAGHREVREVAVFPTPQEANKACATYPGRSKTQFKRVHFILQLVWGWQHRRAFRSLGF